MKKIRIWTDKRRGKERWWVYYGKNFLSGPWGTMEEAVKDKRNWLI